MASRKLIRLPVTSARAPLVDCTIAEAFPVITITCSQNNMYQCAEQCLYCFTIP